MLVLLNGGVRSVTTNSPASTSHSLMLVLLNGGHSSSEKRTITAVALADVSVTEWRTKTMTFTSPEYHVALADVSVTEWRHDPQ